MCDTFVALSNSTINGGVIFGKNSDREPNEPQIIVRVKGRKHQAGEKLKCTYIEIDQAAETNGVILSKPSWMWGAEMGVNEYGLVIGNEAVFTREKQGPEALLGMDMLRLALERCRTSEEAVDYIIYLLETYGQGGKCGYTQNLKYDNSFLITDFNSAYVLETSGRYWIVEKVKDVRSISNGLTIENNYDRIHPDLINNAVNHKWHKPEEEFNFRKSYSDKLYSYFSRGGVRHCRTEERLRNRIGQISLKDAKDILRTHHEDIDGNEFEKGSMKSVCMHAGGLVSSQTTGSMMVELLHNRINIWATGTSLPCLSTYKPLWFTQESNGFFDEEETEKAIELWKSAEQINRMLIENSIENIDDYKKKRNSLEDELSKQAEKAESESVKLEIIKYAYNREKELIEEVINNNTNKNMRIRGNIYFRNYWRNQNKRLK
jgi:dipeptidase